MYGAANISELEKIDWSQNYIKIIFVLRKFGSVSKVKEDLELLNT